LTKLLLIVIVAAVAYCFIRSHARRLARSQPPPPPAAGEDMVRCAQCGVHLPKSESITTRGSYYCCDEHRRLHAS